MRARHSGLSFWAVPIFLLLAAPLSAQTISGIIAGRVTGPQNKPLSSVAITAHNPDTGRDFPASSDDQGYYRILEVPPGAYEVSAVLGGFETQNHIGVRVDVGRTTVEDFPLKILTKQESVTVQSTAPMAVLDSPTLSTAFSNRPITDLPIITRDVNNLALLAPGVQSVRTFSFASTLVPFSVNGSRGRDNNFIIDSVDNNEPLFGGAATQFTNSDIFSEYTILTAQLKPEFGRNSGATVNAITKSGSNNWHGTLFAFGQSDLFDAMTQVEKQALLTSPEPFYDTTVGMTLGGPIKKDKSFFFISYQWDRLQDNLTDVFPVLANYPASPADLNAIIGLPTTPTLQALLATPSFTRVPTLGGTTPCFFGAPPPPNMGVQLYSQTNPCLLTSTPVAINSPFFGPQQFANFNVWNVPNANTFNLRDHQLSGRFDQRINNSNDFFARYLFDDVASPRFPLNSAGTAAFSDVGLLPDWKTINRARSQSFLADHRFQRVNSLNEFRLSYSRVAQAQGTFNVPSNMLYNSSAIVPDVYDSVSNLGQLGGQGGLFSSAGDLLTLGTTSPPTRVASNTYQIQDNYSYSVGRHSLKFGVNFVKIDSNNFSAPDALGFYLYSGFYTGTGFADFATNPFDFVNDLGNPVGSLASVVSQRLVDVRSNSSGQITGLGPNSIKIKEFDQFYFAQDDWRAKDNLTLSFGIRYENFGQPINSVHDINPNAPFVNTDNKDFAPRLGLAWSPARTWVIRAGYGISYNPPILDIPLLIWQSGPVSPLITTDNIGLAQLQPSGAYPSTPLTATDFQQSNTTLFSPGTPIPSGFVQGCSEYFDLYDTLGGPGAMDPVGSRAFNPAVSSPINVPIQNCASQDTVSRNLKNPYVQQWSLGVQKELGSDSLFELDYVGSKGTRLFQRVDLNPYQGWNTTCVANIAAVYAADGDGSLDLPGQCRLPRADNSHGDILEVTNGGSSIYHSLQASFTRRYRHLKYAGNLAFTSAYTWSHLIDNTSEIFGPGFRTLQPKDFAAGSTAGLPILFDPLADSPVESITPLSEITNLTTANERGNSSFDRRHHFAASFLWEPFPEKNVFLRGWQLNGIFTYQSGQPFSPLNASPQSACADATGGGFVGNTRPLIGNPHAPKDSVALIDVTDSEAAGGDPYCVPPGTPIPVGNTPAAATQGPLQYVDLNGNPIDPKNAHFVQMPLGTLTPTAATPGGRLGPITLNTVNGTETFLPAGRNILVGPSLTNLDLTLLRNIKIKERFTLQFRWEVYDVLNHPNLGYFNGSPFVADAAGATAFAYSNQRTAAAITGGIPENSIDAFTNLCAAPPIQTSTCFVTGRTTNKTFLTTSTMNSGNRRMQFGLRFIF